MRGTRGDPDRLIWVWGWRRESGEHFTAGQADSGVHQAVPDRFASKYSRAHSMAGTPRPSGVSDLSGILRRGTTSLGLGFEELHPDGRDLVLITK